MNHQEIKQIAQELNFSDCRIAPATKLDEYQKHYQEFIEQSRHGKMEYLKKHTPLKTNPQAILPGCKSIILVTLNYFQARKDAQHWAPHIHIPKHQEGQVARYAFGRDYHKVFKSKLSLLAKKLNQSYQDSQQRFFADSGPLLERQYAEYSGLGYIGKNTLLITRKYGSWVLIGEILTTVELDYDKPFDREEMVCGSCNKCQVTCPTNALDQDYKMDGSKCISYLTIEHKGMISEELMPKMGSWIFGCDICQEVCPHNFRAKDSQEADFTKAIAGEEMNLQEILHIKNQQEFTAKFAGSPVMRAKREKLVRNALIVAANLQRTDLKDDIQNLLTDPDPTISKTARWSLQQLKKL